MNGSITASARNEPARDPLVINMVLSPDEGDQIKVEWRTPEERYDPYPIRKSLLLDSSADARQELASLVAVVTKKGRGHCGAQLKRLAQAGAQLCEVLFTPAVAHPVPEEAREWLRALKSARMHVEVLSGVHVPWGLVHGGDADALSGKDEDCSIERFGDFWALKYAVTALHCRTNVNMGMKADDVDPSTFRILPLFHKVVLERVKEQLRNEELDALDVFFPKPGYSWADLKARWPEMKANHGLVYFLCHADGTQLALDAREVIGKQYVSTALKRNALDVKTACLVFLNGCATAVGAPHGGFLEATAGHGFFGFIGTECSVPDLFALRFGLAFMRGMLCHGKPLYEVMADLRWRHWPLCLLYSVNCYPKLRVKPSEDRSGLGVWDKEGINFSDPPVGTLDALPWSKPANQ